MADPIDRTPWDEAALGCPTFEIRTMGPAAMASMHRTPGHYTAKVPPLADTRILHEHGFHYCDTLIEPWCRKAKLRAATHPDATLAREAPLEALIEIARDAFVHGRFHRDFAVPRDAAERRYANWLAQLHAAGQVQALEYRGALAGFIAADGPRLVLHAIARPYRGRGLARYWWSALCDALFAAGHPEVTSSISAANLAALNLYASLGFRFRNPLDVYHRMVP